MTTTTIAMKNKANEERKRKTRKNLKKTTSTATTMTTTTTMTATTTTPTERKIENERRKMKWNVLISIWINKIFFLFLRLGWSTCQLNWTSDNRYAEVTMNIIGWVSHAHSQSPPSRDPATEHTDERAHMVCLRRWLSAMQTNPFSVFEHDNHPTSHSVNQPNQ